MLLGEKFLGARFESGLGNATTFEKSKIVNQCGFINEWFWYEIGLNTPARNPNKQ